MNLLLLEETVETNQMPTVISGIITQLVSVATFFWGLFEDLLEMILTNGLIAFPILFGLLMAFVYLVIRVTRRFGLKTRR